MNYKGPIILGESLEVSFSLNAGASDEAHIYLTGGAVSGGGNATSTTVAPGQARTLKLTPKKEGSVLLKLDVAGDKDKGTLTAKVGGAVRATQNTTNDVEWSFRAMK